MLLIAGIDPGLHGAMAVWNADTDGLMALWDLPTYRVIIAGKNRYQIDTVELRAQFDVLKVMGVKLIGVERVQGWGGKGQSASAAFVFGDCFGVIRTLAEGVAPVQYASPGVWKLRERVSKNEKAIVAQADEAFPTWKDRFHGPKGGSYHDRAEAAFLARYFARSVWPTLQPREGMRSLVGPDFKPASPAIVVDPKPLAKPDGGKRKSRSKARAAK